MGDHYATIPDWMDPILFRSREQAPRRNRPDRRLGDSFYFITPINDDPAGPGPTQRPSPRLHGLDVFGHDRPASLDLQSQISTSLEADEQIQLQTRPGSIKIDLDVPLGGPDPFIDLRNDEGFIDFPAAFLSPSAQTAADPEVQPVKLGCFDDRTGQVPIIGLKKYHLVGQPEVFQVAAGRIHAYRGVSGQLRIIDQPPGPKGGGPLEFC